MNAGMLWFDNDSKRTLTAKVIRAAQHYRTKYGDSPTHCFVNPLTLADGETMVGTIRVIAAKHVIRDHFWLGREDTPTKQES